MRSTCRTVTESKKANDVEHAENVSMACCSCFVWQMRAGFFFAIIVIIVPCHERPKGEEKKKTCGIMTGRKTSEQTVSQTSQFGLPSHGYMKKTDIGDRKEKQIPKTEVK